MLVKGLRSGADYDAELPMALMNRHLTGVETVFLPADPAVAHIASSLVKDVARHGGAVEDLVPAGVAAAVRARLAERRADVERCRRRPHRTSSTRSRPWSHAARAMPMSSSVLVNRAEVLALVGAGPGRAARPARACRRGAGGRRRGAGRRAPHGRRVLAAARDRADELAWRRAGGARRAGAGAEEIVAEAEATAAGLRRDADDYCDRRLADFEIDLGRVLAQVQAGRAKLAGRAGPPCRRPDEP